MVNQKTTLRDDIWIGEVRVVRLENEHLRVDITPEIGGRVISIFNKPLGIEFLWKNELLALRPAHPGDAYDPRFYGGIDEVIPGDIPERIGALDCPDHGELWTLPLEAQVLRERLVLRGMLPRWGLAYHKSITLRPSAPWIDLDYRIENRSGEPRVFLWKLHAALNITPGDTLICSAQRAVVADPAWSRWKNCLPFPWPLVQGERADQIPPMDGTTDFLFLYDLEAGAIGCRRQSLNCDFSIRFDTQVFPYVCYFASYGGLNGHYTAVLEPCTAMPVSVDEAARLNQCSSLKANQQLATRVSIYAGTSQLNFHKS